MQVSDTRQLNWCGPDYKSKQQQCVAAVGGFYIPGSEASTDEAKMMQATATRTPMLEQLGDGGGRSCVVVWVLGAFGSGRGLGQARGFYFLFFSFLC
jgi:hypothetical protein